jgi:hypothetical protein
MTAELMCAFRTLATVSTCKPTASGNIHTLVKCMLLLEYDARKQITLDVGAPHLIRRPGRALNYCLRRA